MMLLLLAACLDPAPAGFHVTFSFPQPGEAAFEETPVRVGFSEPIDRTLCGRQALHLAAVDEHGGVLWFEEYELVDLDDPNSFELAHDGLTEGFAHVLAVQSGASGCRSVTGAEIEPYSSDFLVIARED